MSKQKKVVGWRGLGYDGDREGQRWLLRKGKEAAEGMKRKGVRHGELEGEIVREKKRAIERR